jgi:hypothetical protein
LLSGQAISRPMKKGEVAMKKIAVILAMAFTITTGMVPTMAFGFGVLPLSF